MLNFNIIQFFICLTLFISNVNFQILGFFKMMITLSNSILDFLFKKIILGFIEFEKLLCCDNLFHYHNIEWIFGV